MCGGDGACCQITLTTCYYNAAVFMVTEDYHLRDGRVLAAFAYV